MYSPSAPAAQQTVQRLSSVCLDINTPASACLLYSPAGEVVADLNNVRFAQDCFFCLTLSVGRGGEGCGSSLR